MNYGSVNMKTGKVTINKSMNRSGMEYLDTALHEASHLANPKMSEKNIINKTRKLRESIVAII